MSERKKSYSLVARQAGVNESAIIFDGKELSVEEVTDALKKYGGYNDRECENLLMYARFVSRENQFPMVFNGTGKTDKEFIKVRFVLTDTSPTARYKFTVVNTATSTTVSSQESMSYSELLYHMTMRQMSEGTARKLIEAASLVGMISFPDTAKSMCTIEKRKDAQVE